VTQLPRRLVCSTPHSLLNRRSRSFPSHQRRTKAALQSHKILINFSLARKSFCIDLFWLPQIYRIQKEPYCVGTAYKWRRNRDQSGATCASLTSLVSAFGGFIFIYYFCGRSTHAAMTQSIRQGPTMWSTDLESHALVMRFRFPFRDGQPTFTRTRFRFHCLLRTNFFGMTQKKNRNKASLAEKNALRPKRK